MIRNFVRLLIAAALLGGSCAAWAQDTSSPAAKSKQVKPAKPSAPPAAAPPAAADATTAKGAGGSTLLGNRGQGPLEVTSENGIEWQQGVKAYIARGNAVAKRGQTTLYADVLTAYYREITNSNQTEIWRVVADGHVRIATPTQQVVGDHGIYDIDQAVVVMTGQALKLTTTQDVVTARDSLEWYDGKQLAVARGNAVAVRGERRVRGDTLVAQVTQAPGEDSRISRVDGKGHVIVSGLNGQVGTGDNGVYNADTGIATLVGHVTIARGDDTVVGQYGVVDLQTGVSRILPRPPNAEDATRGRVQGLIMPRQKGASGAGSGNSTVPAQKAQP
ncbi:MAG TPA: LptA/OstA family protein [Aliidongia sp.]|uniref:LptA/OstA family protein n=1 Tax=Aliidongia sp. TaxID=1914230 RepID=UPI002DDC91C3|nr:LptA/OstA family protein [Aliidongia sp.]HEV2677897.1 LptA/OstA family protein [Aliidongia sp.]